MGCEKGLLEFGGVPLIVRTIRLVRPFVSLVTVIGPPERYANLGLRTIPDLDYGNTQIEGRSNGPLIGIATALSSARRPWSLILACDLPYLTSEWLGWLLDRAAASRMQAVIPRTRRGLEPLAAVYRRECLKSITKSIRCGVQKVTEALNNVEVEAIDEKEWVTLDPKLLVLKNMNTPANYEEARQWWNSNRLNAKRSRIPH